VKHRVDITIQGVHNPTLQDAISKQVKEHKKKENHCGCWNLEHNNLRNTRIRRRGGPFCPSSQLRHLIRSWLIRFNIFNDPTTTVYWEENSKH